MNKNDCNNLLSAIKIEQDEAYNQLEAEIDSICNLTVEKFLFLSSAGHQSHLAASGQDNDQLQ